MKSFKTWVQEHIRLFCFSSEEEKGGCAEWLREVGMTSSVSQGSKRWPCVGTSWAFSRKPCTGNHCCIVASSLQPSLLSSGNSLVLFRPVITGLELRVTFHFSKLGFVCVCTRGSSFVNGQNYQLHCAVVILKIFKGVAVMQCLFCWKWVKGFKAIFQEIDTLQ